MTDVTACVWVVAQSNKLINKIQQLKSRKPTYQRR